MKHLLLAAWGWVWLALPAPAVQFIPLTIEELTAQAQLVVHGQVLSRSCQEDAAGRIYTRVELEVREVWKGQWQKARLVVVHGGGVLGEKRQSVSGQADYAVGDEVVVFAVFNPRGEAVTLGLRQGHFRVQTDAATGERVAANGFAHAPPAARQDKSLAPAATTPTTQVSLRELKQRVEAVQP